MAVIAGNGAVPLVLGGDHTVTRPDVTGVSRHHGAGRISVIHFDAHADTGDIEFGSLYGHGQPMRRLIESGAVRGDRFLQLGLFLSVDIDVCDPGHAPGTGTPEPGGLTARELLDSVSRICHELPVVGMDIVEVSPPFDHAEITAMLGNRVVLEALSGMARRRKDGDGPRWRRSTPLLQDREG